MIERQYGKIIFICDSCGDSLETDTKDFEEARQRGRDAGIRTFKSRSGAWMNYCSECEGED